MDYFFLDTLHGKIYYHVDSIYHNIDTYKNNLLPNRSLYGKSRQLLFHQPYVILKYVKQICFLYVLSRKEGRKCFI